MKFAFLDTPDRVSELRETDLNRGALDTPYTGVSGKVVVEWRWSYNLRCPNRYDCVQKDSKNQQLTR